MEEELKQNCKGGGRSTNLGEIKTALLAAIFSLSNIERVTIFMSDDRRARNFIVSRYSEKYHEIKAISVIGAFYILMKNGMPLEEARRYCMTEQEEKLINAAQEIIFTARLSGNDLVQFGREVAQILFDYGLLEKEPYEILTGKV